MGSNLQTGHAVDQQVAALEAKLARRKEAQRNIDNGQKYVIGGALLALARKNDADRKYLLDMLEKHVKRPADVRRIRPIIEELKGATAERPAEKNAAARSTLTRPGTFETRPDTREI